MAEVIENLNIPKSILAITGNDTFCGIVDASDSRSIAREIENFTYSRNNGFGMIESIEPRVDYLDNSGFKLVIADGESVGKYNLVTCELEHESGIKIVVGIPSNNLMRLICKSTCINGTVSEAVSVAKYSGGLFLVHEGMEEWKKSRQYKNSSNGYKKTVTREVGRVYETLTTKEIYLGKLYNWVSLEEETKVVTNRNGWKERHIYNTIKVVDKPNILNVECGLYYIQSDLWEDILGNKIRSVKDLIDIDREKLTREGLKPNIYSVRYLSSIISNGLSDKKTSSKYKTEFILDATNAEENMQSLIDTYRRVLRTQFESGGYEASISEVIHYIGLSTCSSGKPELSDEEKEFILYNLGPKVTVDFGDGVLHIGRRGG